MQHSAVTFLVHELSISSDNNGKGDEEDCRALVSFGVFGSSSFSER